MKCKACKASYRFFATSLIINSIIQEQELLDSIYSYNIKITLKSQFWCANILIKCIIVIDVIT